jgi:hypothetical protein
LIFIISRVAELVTQREVAADRTAKAKLAAELRSRPHNSGSQQQEWIAAIRPVGAEKMEVGS